jgi:DDE_Tnp_1-associated
MNYSMKVAGAVEFEVNSLYEALLKVKDKRKARGKRYKLATVLTLSVLAKLGGEDEPEGMAEWVKHRAQELQAPLGLKRQSMPHAVTYRRIFGQAIAIEEFEQVLGAFFKGCQEQDEQLAMDGKTLRGTIESGQTRGVHLLAVYAVKTGVVLHQVNVHTKENEISAAPKALAGVEVKGHIITGDAMFTQRDLSSQIVEAGGIMSGKSKTTNRPYAPTLNGSLGQKKYPWGQPHCARIFRPSPQRPKPMVGSKPIP